MLQEPSPQQYELEMVTMEQLVPKTILCVKLTLLCILNLLFYGGVDQIRWTVELALVGLKLSILFKSQSI